METTDKKVSDNDENHYSTSQTETDGALPGDKGSPDNSEYDSADADSYSDEDENVKVRSRASDNEDSEDGDGLILEREEGDGQESIPNKKVDHDEDKKNPQYIPKRGTFYEHDDRTLEDTEEKIDEEVEKDKDGKKKIWQDKKEKWSHDRFNEPEQAPKSRAELIAIYGYDIRNEEGPPRARRRRKYGRGPNKYTRNWEDEDAYNKPPPPVVKKGKKPVPRQDEEEYPPLIRNSDYEQNNERDISPKEEEVVHPTTLEIRNDQPKENFNSSPPRSEHSLNSENYNNKSNQQRVGAARMNNSNREPIESDYNGFTTKSRNTRTRRAVPQKVLPPKSRQKEDFIQSQNFYLSNKNSQDLEKDMGRLNIDEGNKSNLNKNSYNSSSSSQRQSSVPPRLQSEQKGPKRYSSMRQKSLPETNTPPLTNYQHVTTFYPNEYNQQSVPSPTQPLLHQNPQILATTAQVAHVTPLQPSPLPQQVSASAAPLLQAATFATQPYPQPPPTFIQPTAVAAPFLPPQTTQLINFVQPPASFQPNFQGYQPSFNSVNPPTELYQPQGGITYYSTDQQFTQRQVPQKRPKAAIPIVAPPAYDKKDELQSNIAQMESNETVEVQQ